METAVGIIFIIQIIYVKEIVRRAENIDFFWYDEGARERFQSICNSEHSKVQINFIKW